MKNIYKSTCIQKNKNLSLVAPQELLVQASLQDEKLFLLSLTSTPHHPCSYFRTVFLCLRSCQVTVSPHCLSPSGAKLLP